MPVPSAIALVVFSLGLVGLGAVGALSERATVDGDAKRDSAFDNAFGGLLAGMALVSVLMMILGIFGVFSIGAIAASVALFAAGWWWTGRSGKHRPPDGPAAARLAVGFLIPIVAAMGAFVLLRPYEAQVNSSDASLYLGGAAHLETGGAFVEDDPLVAEMARDERQRFFAKELFNTGRAGAYYHRFPGGVQLLDPAGSAVSFNFYHLWPAWLALGLKLMGSHGFLAMLSLFVAMSAISLFMVGRLIGGPVFAIAPVVVLFATFPQLHYSRLPLSELPAQAFFLAGLFCFLRAMRASGTEQCKFRLLAGALWGCLCLSRADGALLLFPALCLSYLVVPQLRRSASQWLPMTLPLIVLAGLAVLHQVAVNAYETPFANSPSIGETVRFLARGIRDHEGEVVIGWFALIGATAVLASRSPMLRWAVTLFSNGFFLLATLVWVVAFPLSADWQQVLQHVRWLELYLPEPVLPLIAAGIAIAAIAAIVRPARGADMRLLLVLLAVPSMSFLINPMVTPLQPWGIRRFVPMVFPLLVLCAVLGFKEALSLLPSKHAERFRYSYLVMPAVLVAFLVPQAVVLWRQPLYQDIARQLDSLTHRIPSSAIVLMPYSMAGVAVAMNYDEGRSSLLLPLEADADAAPPRPMVTAYIARQLAAGRKVLAMLRRPPDPSDLLPSNFDVRPMFSGTISYFHLPQVDATQFPGSTAEVHLAYEVVEVTPRAAAPAVQSSSDDDLRRLLASGLDFTKHTLPTDLTAVTGLSQPESAGRWTDGPMTLLRFSHPLPRRFSLELDIAAAYARDPSVPIKVIVGDESKDVYLTNAPGKVRLDFAPAAPADAIVIRISNPVSPKSRGESADARQLGIQLMALRIVASDVIAAPQDKRGSRPSATTPTQAFTGGIDFATTRLPDFVAAVDGISGFEPRGRWTDGTVARVRLRQPLPRKFTLEIVVAEAYGPNRGQPITVRIGGEAKTFSLQRAPETVRLSFAPAQPGDAIALEIPHPTSPASRGESADTRKLGIRLQAMRVIATDH